MGRVAQASLAAVGLLTPVSSRIRERGSSESLPRLTYRVRVPPGAPQSTWPPTRTEILSIEKCCELLVRSWPASSSSRVPKTEPLCVRSVLERREPRERLALQLKAAIPLEMHFLGLGYHRKDRAMRGEARRRVIYLRVAPLADVAYRSNGSAGNTGLVERHGSSRRSALAITGPRQRVGGDDVGGVTIERDAGAVVAHGRSRVGMRGRFLHITQRDAGVQCAAMNAWRRVCGPMGLSTPARRATRRTIRLAQCRSIR